MSLVDIFWIYFILTSLQPWISQRSLEWKRVKLLDKFERERHCRVIALVHRQETMSLLGFPVLRYINIEHSEEVLRAIKLTDRQVPINFTSWRAFANQKSSFQLFGDLKPRNCRIAALTSNR